MQDKKFDFKSLTPKTDVDLTGYKEALQFALSDTEIKNIAITGSYGAGKSSVLETFKKTEYGKQYNYLHISLAHFERTTELKNENKTAEEEKRELQNIELQLEGKILNQLIHKIPMEKILHSNVALKKIPDLDSVMNWTWGIVTGILIIMYFVLYMPMVNLETTNSFLRRLCRILTKQEFFILAVCVGSGLMFQLVKYLVTVQMKTRFFKRICIKDSEIELFGEEPDKSGTFSYFDKYLDEIKYLLQNADVDIFVFEDIDRYNTNLIFAKLREINGIINVSSNRLIRFFYLIRDDLFEQKDRAKFFDFIIPILPVISGHNSFNMFLAYMGKEDKTLSRNFLKQISLYIDDMRILNNIYNEYQIYYEKLKAISVGKSVEKIFALVTYKNLFPEDFIRLQRGEGYVAALFKEKDKQIEIKDEELKYIIDELEEQIETCDKDIATFRKKNDSEEVKRIKGVKWELKNRQRDYEYKRERLNVSMFREYVENNSFNILKDSILKGDNSNYHKKITESLYADVIKFLLTNGYIDEDYGDFMVMFHNSDISANDKKFVRAVLENEPLEYMYPVQQPKIVAEYLQECNLDRPAAINLNMFCYYMNSGTYEEKNAVISAIHDSESYDFICLLMENIELPYWVWGERVYYYGPNIIKYMRDNEIDEVIIQKFGAVLLLCTNISWLQDLNDKEGEFLQNVVCSNAATFEQVFQHDRINGDKREKVILKLAENLKSLAWKLPYFEFDMGYSKDIGDMIYSNQLYAININMIREILWKWHAVYIDERESHLYDIIATTYEEDGKTHIKLYDYIKENVNTFIDMVLESHIELNDSSQNLLELLLLADDVHKELLVMHMNTCICNVSDVPVLEEVNRLIQYKKLEYKPENIFAYYNLYMDEKSKYENIEFYKEDFLIKYIKGFPNEKICIPDALVREYTDKNEDRMNNLFIKISYDTELPYEKYRPLVKCLHRVWKQFVPADIPLANIEILIEENIIEMTKETLGEMREKYPRYIKKFILCNIDKYVNQIIDESNFDSKECMMLQSEDIMEEYKKKLLEIGFKEE